MTPISTVMSHSMSRYLSSQTSPRPIRPEAIANTLLSTPGNSAASGRAVEDIAVAPYTMPQMRMYGPKYQDVQAPRVRQPWKIVLPVER